MVYFPQQFSALSNIFLCIYNIYQTVPAGFLPWRTDFDYRSWTKLAQEQAAVSVILLPPCQYRSSNASFLSLSICIDYLCTCYICSPFLHLVFSAYLCVLLLVVLRVMGVHVLGVLLSSCEYCGTVGVLQYFTLNAGLLARSQHSEGPCDRPSRHTFFMVPLRWFPIFQVATTCFSCSPTDLI